MYMKIMRTLYPYELTKSSSEWNDSITHPPLYFRRFQLKSDIDNLIYSSKRFHSAVGYFRTYSESSNTWYRDPAPPQKKS